MTDINFTKYVTTPKGRQVKAVVRDKNNIPRIDEMGETMEVGVAEYLTNNVVDYGKDIEDPVALTTRQLLDLGILGAPKSDIAAKRELSIQLYNVDIIVFPRAMFEKHILVAPHEILNWDLVEKHCVTVQVKYQPLSFGYRTINYETRQIFDYRTECNKQPTERETKHNADFTAYVITDQVIIFAPSGTYATHARAVSRDYPLSSGKKFYAKNNENGYFSRTNFTKRLNINTLLSDSTTQILALSPLFSEYHLKAADALEDHEWENSSIGHGYFSQSWSLETLKDYLRFGIDGLFEGGKLKEGLTLRGSVHWVH